MSTIVSATSLASDVEVTARRVYSRWLTYTTIVFADLVGFALAGTLAVLIRFVFHAKFLPGDYLSFAPSILIFLAVFAFSGLYPGIPTSPIEEFRLILRSSSIGFLLLVGTTFFLREGILASRIVFLLFWMFIVVFIPVSRRMVRGWCSLQPWWGIPTVVLGERTTGLMMMELLAGHKRMGLRPVALLIDEEHAEPFTCTSNPDLFIGDFSYAKRLARCYKNCYIVVAMPNASSERIRAIFSDYADHYHRVLIIPDLFGMRSQLVTAKDVCGVLALEVEQNLARFRPQFTKRCFDLAVSASILIALAPILLLLCLLVRLSSKGPIFYAQRRIGKDGREFLVWKYRSMVVDADAVLQSHLDRDPQLRAEWTRDHKLKRDPRVTWIGRLLRKSSLDELPQVWNILSGDMSLVGPRPITSAEIERYGQVYAQYRRVNPGITGLWQISGRNNTTYQMRTHMDDYYVRNWSISLDIYILFRTLKTIFLTEGAY